MGNALNFVSLCKFFFNDTATTKIYTYLGHYPPSGGFLHAGTGVDETGMLARGELVRAGASDGDSRGTSILKSPTAAATSGWKLAGKVINLREMEVLTPSFCRDAASMVRWLYGIPKDDLHHTR
jgi:hypothetical protein